MKPQDSHEINTEKFVIANEVKSCLRQIRLRRTISGLLRRFTPRNDILCKSVKSVVIKFPCSEFTRHDGWLNFRMALQKQELERILAIALAKGGDFADIYIEKVNSTRIKYEDDKIKQIVSGEDSGIGLRIIRGDETHYRATSDLTKKGLIELQKSSRYLPVRRARSDGNVGHREVRLRSLVKTKHQIAKQPSRIPVEEKVRLVKIANHSARQVDRRRVKQVTVGYNDATVQVTIANSSGNYLEETKVYTNLGISVVAREGKIVQTGTEIIGGLKGWEIFAEENIKQKAKLSAQRALRMLSAKRSPTGVMPVVLSSEAGGTMIHEAIGHSLEADAVQKGISPAYKGKIGKQVASRLVTVIDDPTLPNKRGSYKFDDEGMPAQKTILVENGILKNYLYDWYTAGKDKIQTTGNGRRQSYADKPIPRMSNTYIAPGDTDPEAIIRSVEKGLFVKRMGGGQVNTATGDFVFEVSEGYQILGGKIGQPLRGAILLGNGPEVLKSIDLIGSDLNYFAPGSCGKDGQLVPVSDAQPTLRIPELTVGGSQQK